jgi:hypothetical protein
VVPDLVKDARGCLGGRGKQGSSDEGSNDTHRQNSMEADGKVPAAERYRAKLLLSR